jgi:hypothetical protein
MLQSGWRMKTESNRGGTVTTVGGAVTAAALGHGSGGL